MLVSNSSMLRIYTQTRYLLLRCGAEFLEPPLTFSYSANFYMFL